MLKAADVKETVFQAQHVLQQYLLLDPVLQEQYANMDKVKELLNGNSHSLDLEAIEEMDSPLKGKTIGYLGSSITVGMKSENVAFPDYIGRRTGSKTIKQAISGGTLVYKKSDADHDYRENISYIKQLLDVDGPLHAQDQMDLLLVQLSTNDTTMDIAMGALTGPEITNGFDYSTVYGAIETIVSTAKAWWNCPVMFYINPYIQKEEYSLFDEATQKEIYQNLVVKYEGMITALYEIQKKWQFGIIDLWNEPTFKKIDLNLKKYYMADIIHPYKSGYLFWYTPFIQKAMEMYYQEKTNNEN
jgi:hypothetical protein